MSHKSVAKPKVGAIIVAAGSSRRMNGVDKILAPLGGQPVLGWSVAALQQSPLVDRIVLVNSQSNLEPVRCLVADKQWSKVEKVCLGGLRRQDSVAAGLKTLDDCEWIIVHDGARPFLTEELIENGLLAARETGAAIAAVPVTDTIKLAGNDKMVIETPPRSHLWAVQTPQVFRLSIIKEAYQQAAGEVTDDAMLVEQIGYKVKIYQGSYDNLKITTPQDLAVAELLLKDNFFSSGRKNVA
jgi:2-C-methyl-D-erythritol 4-phosphate cytidylyltransferase